ncbi:MAG: hypothetical protein U1E29_18305 [Coriobacteriia bacterium]|nr:hypothetical protein [Coriobacteriia bacterium]
MSQADGSIIIDTKIDESGFKSGVGSLTSMAGGAALAIGAAVVGAGAAFIALAKEGEASLVADKRLGQIAVSMGLFGASADDVTARLISLADVQSRALGVDDDTIKAAQAKLLTFAGLAASADEVGGSFDRATTAAIDLAAAGFGEAEQNAVQLGKALQDPIKGITALAKSGVTFTQAEKDMIAAMVEAGDMAGAQNLVLAAIEKQVGGTAAATATGSARMGVAFDELKESIGVKLLPMFERFSSWAVDEGIPAAERFVASIDFAAIAAKVQPFIDFFVKVKDGAGTLDSFATALSESFGVDISGPVATLQGIFDGIKTTMAPVIDQLRESFAKLAEGAAPALESLSAAWEQMKPALTLVAQILGGVLAVAMGVVIGVLNGIVQAAAPFMEFLGGIVEVVAGVFNLIIGIFTGDGDKIKEAWDGIVSGVVNMVEGFVGTVIGLFKGFGKGIVSFFVGLYDTLVGNSIVPDMINDIVEWFAGLPAKVIDAISSLAAMLYTTATEALLRFHAGVVEKAALAMTFFSGLPAQIIAAIASLAGKLFDTAKDALTRFNAGLAEKLVLVIGFFSGLPAKINAALGNMATQLLGSGKDLVMGLWNGMSDKVAWLKSKIRGFVGNVTQWLKDFFGIGSPSKVFKREIGFNLALGLGQGFSEKMGEVKRQMASAVGDMTASVRSEAARVALSAPSMTGGGSLTVMVDARGATDPEAVRRAGTTGVMEALENAVVMGRLRADMMRGY